ncbi:hypothetical protein HDU96_000903 [Phlyctochytrium bullatum]|nr:hypothetical protein HDU96_000903 [Phlyctochytrium bullatum]
MARTKSTARKAIADTPHTDTKDHPHPTKPSTSKPHPVLSLIKHHYANLKKGLQDAIADNGSLAPVIGLLGGSQLQACLFAFLPGYLGINTGNMAIDMFAITFVSTAVMAVLTVIGNMIKGLIMDNGVTDNDSDVISVKVEFHRVGKWGSLTQNIHWTALANLISHRSRTQQKGAFRMATFESENNACDSDDDNLDMPEFNILPRGDDELEIEYEGATFKVYFEQQQDENSDENKKKKEEDSLLHQEPPIVIRRIDKGEPVDLAWMQAFLQQVTTSFLRAQKEKRSRARYERHATYSYWHHVQNLRASRGLDSVALDRVQEELLRRDLETFHSDAEFYKRMGLPYRRGYLFSGKPGTGKTSLVNAISATYNRDLYYINLKEIRDDNALQSAFSSVPKRSIIVFEDIDAQSAEVHSRDRRFALKRVERMRMQREKEAQRLEEKKKKEKERKKKEKIKELKRLKKKKKAEAKKARKAARKANGDEGDDVEDEEEEEEEDDEESEIDEDAIEVSDSEPEKPTKGPGGGWDTMSVDFGDDSDMEPMGFIGPSPGPSSFGGSSSSMGKSSGSDGKFGGLSLGGNAPLFSGFTLSALLNCLDGHMMNEDVIIIMTTNHPEVLDPALIRPGRIDLHLELGYCTRYQLDRMFACVMDKPNAVVDFSGVCPAPGGFPEGVIAPCDALRIMVLYRSNPGLIPVRLMERALEILHGKPATSGLRAGQGGISLGGDVTPAVAKRGVPAASPIPSTASSTGATAVGGGASPSPTGGVTQDLFGASNDDDDTSVPSEDGDAPMMGEGLRKRLNAAAIAEEPEDVSA